MKRLLAAVLLICSLPCHALEELPAAAMDEYTYRIEVLQVTDIAPYQESLNGFLNALQENGIVEGKNLVINRVKVDFDIENGGFWDRVGVLRQVRREAIRIAAARPDLVLTIGTPATKYARWILDDARIPLVFTAVANPQDAGCTSLTDAGPGVTGATLYTDMSDSLKIVKVMFPAVEKIGMVHTDDENGVAHVETARAIAKDNGIEVSSRLVRKNDGIAPYLAQLFEHGAGAQMFAVPLDTYYGLRNLEPAKDLGEFAALHQIPVVSFAMVRVPGAALYVGAEFARVGNLSGTQAVKILKTRTSTDALPILRQEKPTVLIDPERVAALKVELSPEMLERKAQGKDGFWEISGER